MTFDLYAMGNALVDHEFQVSDERLKDLGVDKGHMTLVDEERMAALMTKLRGTEMRRTGGGSAGNTVVALAQLGGSACFSYRVAEDGLGAFYTADLQARGVSCRISDAAGAFEPTGQCLVLVTPDAQRSMSTLLGISSLLDDTALDEAAVAQARYYYMEGYLSSSPTGCKAALRGRDIARSAGVKLALTLSDVNMVRYCRSGLEAMMEGGVDLLFCNEEESQAWTGLKDLNARCEALRAQASMVCLTRGSLGCVVLTGDQRIEVPAPKVTAVDTNGAGDMFAGAFMYAVTQGHRPEDAADLANHAAAAVVSQSGNRLDDLKVAEIKAAYLDRRA